MRYPRFAIPAVALSLALSLAAGACTAAPAPTPTGRPTATKSAKPTAGSKATPKQPEISERPHIKADPLFKPFEGVWQDDCGDATSIATIDPDGSGVWSITGGPAGGPPAPETIYTFKLVNSKGQPRLVYQTIKGPNLNQVHPGQSVPITTMLKHAGITIGSGSDAIDLYTQGTNGC